MEVKKGGRSAPLRDLAAVELDHEVRFHLHRIGHVRKFRHAAEGRFHFLRVHVDILRHITLRRCLRLEHEGELLRLFLHLDHIARFHVVARDVDATAIHLNVAVVHELTRRELLVTLDKDLNAGNWISQFPDFKLRLTRRLGAENVWVVAYDGKQADEKTVIDMLKNSKGVLNVQPNGKTEQRD